MPIAYAARPAKLLRTWDKFVIPSPFAKINFAIGEPFYPKKKMTDEEMALAQRELERRMHEAFKIAQEHRDLQYPGWPVDKVDTMRNILRAKADQHEYVRRKLLATDDRELVEDSWRDDFWGWGPNRDGQNMLGKLWMEIRAELRGSQDGS